MRENDLSQLILGDKLKDITTQDHKVVTQWYLPNSENLYKGSFCVNNPNMMYIREFGEFPLMSIEVHAWMIARIVTNQMALPSKKEMKADGLRSVLECLQHPTMRYFMDWKYQNAIDDADARWSLSELTYNTAHEKDGWRSFRDTPSIE